jgi:outer membrane protein assembly factor BamB
MKVTVTKPDGTTETLNMPDSDAAGGTWTWYTPATAGTYKFVFNFPGQVAVSENPYPYPPGFVPLGADYLNDTYLPSTSKEFSLTVQTELVESAYPPNPLPTEFWSRPINSLNRDNWYVLGGNWLGLAATSFGATGMYSNTGNFNPYTTAPESAHVLWTLPEAFGGQIGGEFGPDETSLYSTGTAYETKFGAVILYGILYYSAYPGAGNNLGPLTAVDLRTGKTLWAKQVDFPLRVGMVLKFNTGDQYGAHAYLFTEPASIGFIMTPANFAPKWQMYDAMTGQWILDIANDTAGTLVRGGNGEILSYAVGGGMLNMWNISKCIAVGSQKNNIYQTYSSAEIWRPPQGATLDWNDGYEWSVPIATTISGVPIIPDLAVSKVSDDVVLTTAEPGFFLGGAPGGSQLGYRVDAAYNAKTGQLLWGPINRTLTPHTTDILTAGEGVYCEYTMQTMTWVGYDIKTGQKLWGPTQPTNSTWAYYDFTAPSVLGYGNLYSWGLAGEVYCYDAKTGVRKWSFNTGNSGIDSPFGSWPLGTWSDHHILADGKLYVRAGHDYTAPVFKGANIYCLNATTGDLLWKSLSFDIGSSPACADGVMVWFNGYDNQIYAYGKGPSATTVTAPDVGIAFGSSVVIRGTVTDKSPGTEEYAQTARFPNGVPAMADESMSAWMEYLYQQQPLPSNAKGVTVTISVLDSNNNYRNIGTATTDSTGAYSLMWTPDVPGKYTVTATFAGSESYYASYASTAFGVDEAPEPTVAPTNPPASLADQYILPGIGGIIAAIAIVGVVLALLLRRR